MAYGTLPDLSPGDAFPASWSDQAWLNFQAIAAVQVWQVISTTTRATDGALTISAIAGTYTHLQLVGNLRSAAASTAFVAALRFNGDTAANYDDEHLEGNGATPAAATGAATSSAEFAFMPGASSTANVFGTFEILLPNYTNTAFRRTGSFRGGTTEPGGLNDVRVGVLGWRNTAAITQIDIWDSTTGANNWKTGSTVTLLGLKSIA